ncbi:hypothetical protein GKC68_10470 [Pantoea sp. RSPAM1]|uniref:ATP-binding protein n=1 Tax=Pantoea sp. RSPAM1 TaxID=2675223 RepID=UPI00315D0E55
MQDLQGSDLRLEFSHNIIEHLGLKLYQNKPTNVIAELISNSWDADADNAWLNVSELEETGEHCSISVIDDGYGMDPASIKEKYLVIGLKKRTAHNPAEKSLNKNRSLMGRKGIGKLAPFGIAGKLTVMTVYKNNTESKISVFTLDIDKMLESDNAKAGAINQYPPDVIYFDHPLNDIVPGSLSKFGFEDFCNKIQSTGSGTCIYMSDLKLKKNISVERLAQSIGRRFTVTIAKQGFNVFINDNLIEAKHSLPNFDLRYPSEGYDVDKILIKGVEREVRCWVGFVEKADWPQDEAGVGVYAHGKIAQDRPFFFGVKGKEIYTRYMYGVIEADWLDELKDDVISTDRTSINWEDDETAPLFQHCHQKVKFWVEKFRRDHSPGGVEKLKKVMEDNSDLPRVTKAEQTAIVELVHKLGPTVHQNKEVQLEVIKAMTSSWTHKPMQVLVKKLWDAFDISESNTDAFTNSLKCLNEHLVPESLSMSVIQAQRIYALSKLYSLKNNGNENQLQALLETFPWILGTEMENLRANQSLKANAAEAARMGFIPVHGALKDEMAKDPNAALRPDFVFFSNESEKEIVVVELKNPQIPLEIKHRSQLTAYLDWFESQYNCTKLSGILIGQDAQKLNSNASNLVIKSWEDVYIESRREHLELLAAMLHGVSDHYDDARVSQVLAMGGEHTRELLMKITNAHSPLKDLFSKTDAKLLKKITKIPKLDIKTDD